MVWHRTFRRQQRVAGRHCTIHFTELESVVQRECASRKQQAKVITRGTQKCLTPNPILGLLHQSSNTRFNTGNLHNSTMKFDINLQCLLWMDLSPWPLASVTNQNYLGSFVNINKSRLTLHLQNQSLGVEWLWKSSPDESDTEPPYQPLTSDYCQHKSSAVCKAWLVPQSSERSDLREQRLEQHGVLQWGVFRTPSGPRFRKEKSTPYFIQVEANQVTYFTLTNCNGNNRQKAKIRSVCHRQRLSVPDQQGGVGYLSWIAHAPRYRQQLTAPCYSAYSPVSEAWQVPALEGQASTGLTALAWLISHPGEDSFSVNSRKYSGPLVEAVCVSPLYGVLMADMDQWEPEEEGQRRSESRQWWQLTSWAY